MGQDKTTKIKAETIITGHTNADFDCLAAMVAASKLYPGAVLIFPGSQEKNLHDFFIHSATYLYNFKPFKNIDADSVKRAVIVDTRQRSRLPHIDPVLDKPDLEIHLYDHHPDSEDDLKGDYKLVKPWGSTTAILIGLIREKGLDVSEDQATLLGLGIYEDTGSLIFPSTTEHDLEAAAWLRRKGMDLVVISDLLSRDLTAEQVAILNSLLESGTTHVINGVEVVIAEASTENYVGDFAVLVHKLLEMENIRVLFALGRMNDRVHLVARSRSPNVDVGQIATSFGGGGHPYAASATIKDKTPSQIKDQLFALLYSHINPQILVKDVMSRPAVTLDSRKTIREVDEILTGYGFKSMPVTDSETGRLLGIIEHRQTDKAKAYGLGDVKASEYMLREIQAVAPDADLYNVMEIILDQGQPMIPVLENDRVVGVITRTDLVNILIQEPARIPESLYPRQKRERIVKSMLKDRLPDEVYDLLVLAGELGRELGYRVYAVGGFVRDIFLGEPNYDLDLVIEGDGILFAKAMAEKLNGRVRSHQKFKTAVVVYDDDKKIDVATARLEYYEYPAALPTVELSSIKMDLFRRDFTINALAVHLNPDSFGRVVDFFGGQLDLKERVIRVLHSLSFVDDPTRILRAVRFEQRFNFKIGAQTRRLIKNAVQLKLFNKLSGNRIFHEFKLILEDKDPLACIKRMEEFDLLQAISPVLKLDRTRERILEEIQNVLNWYELLYQEPKPRLWLTYFLGFCSGLSDGLVLILIRRLNFSRRLEMECSNLRKGVRDAVSELFNWQHGQQRMSDLYFILSHLSIEGVLYLMARSQKEGMRKNISLYLTKYRNMKISVTGEDLKNMGLSPGPVYGDILREVQAAMIDGVADGRATQLELAAKLVSVYKHGSRDITRHRVLKTGSAR